MSVILLVGTPAYNKAPAPAKTPSKTLFPITKVIEDDQTVWVSNPQPDKLYLTVQLKPDHFSSSYQPTDAQDYGRMIMHSLAMGQAGKALLNKYVEAANLSTEVQINLANQGESVFFKLSKTKGDPKGLHTLSIQINPAKIGQQGCFEFLDLLCNATSKRLWVGRMLADARVSRLDVAVDLVGVPITEVLASVKGAAKEAAWRSTDGDVETLSFHRKKQKKSGAIVKGAAIATVYDKRAERIAAGFPAPHGPAPVTRIEVSKQRFGNKPFFLSMLPAIANPLTPLRVGMVRSALTPVTPRFIQYASIRRVYGPQRAAGILNLASNDAGIYENALSQHSAHLIDGDAVWAFWEASMKETGLDLLIEAAATGSHGVPLPICDVSVD